MTDKWEMTPDVDRNPYNGKWDIGWRDLSDGSFAQYGSEYDTEAEAKAALPSLDEMVKADLECFDERKRKGKSKRIYNR